MVETMAQIENWNILLFTIHNIAYGFNHRICNNHKSTMVKTMAHAENGILFYLLFITSPTVLIIEYVLIINQPWLKPWPMLRMGYCFIYYS
jgi:hypothetical protein